MRTLVFTAAFATIAACADSITAPPAPLDSEPVPALHDPFQAASAAAPIKPAGLLAIGISGEGRIGPHGRGLPDWPFNGPGPSEQDG